MVKLCSDWGQRVKGSSLTRHSTDHGEPLILLGVSGETNFVTWEGELWVGKRAAVAPLRVTLNLVGFRISTCMPEPGTSSCNKSDTNLALVAAGVLALRLAGWC